VSGIDIYYWLVAAWMALAVATSMALLLVNAPHGRFTPNDWGGRMSALEVDPHGDPGARHSRTSRLERSRPTSSAGHIPRLPQERKALPLIICHSTRA
jgi:hypothetical protein